MRFGILAATLFFAIGCGARVEDSKSTVHHDTPEAAFAAAKAAIEQDDMGAFYDTLSPESREDVAGMLVTYLTASVRIESFRPPGRAGADPEASERFASGGRRLLQKHGISWKSPAGAPDGVERARAQARAQARDLPDARAFVVEAWKLVKDAGQIDDVPLGDLGGELLDVKIDGDSASASYEVEGAGMSSLQFRRIDGGWRIHRR